MPVAQPVPSIKPEPDPVREDAVERELAQLAALIEDAQGMFALLLVRSDCSTEERNTLLARLGAAIAPLPVRTISLTHENYQAPVLIAEAAAEHSDGVLVLTGLEDTPGIVQEPGSAPQRPPAIALLNHSRESIRRSCPLPLILWCDPLSYRALREHAPDFFDHFAGLFTFIGSAKGRTADIQTRVTAEKATRNSDSGPHATALAELDFYESLLRDLPLDDGRRTEALFRLVHALLDVRDQQWASRAQRAVELIAEGLGRVSEKDGQLWAEAHLTAGRLYNELPGGDRAENQRRAIACYEAALRVWAEADYPADWAATQNNLGNAYCDLPIGNRAENLRRAIACYKAALRVWTEADNPADWAAAQNNLGIAYRNLPPGGRAEDLRRAIACYKAALRVWTEVDFPADWAMTQNNLGNAYVDLPTGDRIENLRRAIACYKAALRVWTEADYPADWAMTQNNLGNAYRNLPTGDRIENLRRAIACYEAALRVCTEYDYPVDWAMTQNNLGNAYRNLPTGDRVENLHRAIACYEAALRVRTEADYPAAWAMTTRNLGFVYRDLARQAFEDSERGYEAVGATQDADWVRRQLKQPLVDSK